MTEIAPTELRLVLESIEQHARVRPDALAATDGARTLTYGELDSAASGAGAILRRRSVGPDVFVGLLLERSLDALVAFLGIWKAGGAAILLDPSWPEERIRDSLASLRPVAVVSSVRVSAPVSDMSIPVVSVDAIEPLDGPCARVPVHLDHLAYVIQTSGSTGRPKSVGVTHRSVAHVVRTHIEGHRIVPEDRSSWLAPPGSSVAVGEVWPYLAMGASVHIADPATVASPGELQEWMLGSRITKSYLSMPLAEQLYRRVWPPSTPLALITVGSDSVRVWPDGALPFEVAVSYGSSEANGVCSCLVPWVDRCTSASATPEQRSSRPPIGRPWPDVDVFVVDERLEPVPSGAIGELCVASPELARGYLGDPAQSAERFVPNPFGSASRLYRTGDLVRRRPDGLLEHHGRIDHQIKVLGHRVEPAEIEAALLEHPAVSAAVVTSQVDPRGETRLVAYVVLDGPGATVSALREAVMRRIPQYAVPSAYVFLDALPLNASNKVDRGRLPPPDWSIVRVGPPVEPQDELEREILAIWTRELQVDDAGMTDNFFYFGGDSLSASSLVDQLRERFRVRLRLRDLFTEPTPAALAARIRAALERPR